MGVRGLAQTAQWPRTKDARITRWQDASRERQARGYPLKGTRSTQDRLDDPDDNNEQATNDKHEKNGRNKVEGQEDMNDTLEPVGAMHSIPTVRSVVLPTSRYPLRVDAHDRGSFMRTG
jgi:hypothetical protein